jgi:hypothetical protein
VRSFQVPRCCLATQDQIDGSQVEITTLSAEGLATVSGGAPDQRVGTPGDGLHVDQGNYTTAQGHLVLAADGRTVDFVPLDQDDLDAVIDADEA